MENKNSLFNLTFYFTWLYYEISNIHRYLKILLKDFFLIKFHNFALSYICENKREAIIAFGVIIQIYRTVKNFRSIESAYEESLKKNILYCIVKIYFLFMSKC